MSNNGRRTIALALHLATIVGAPLALGGVHTPVPIVCVALGVAAFALQLVWRARAGIGFAPGPLGWVFAGTMGLAALQLVPLPPALLALLSPEAAELRAGASALTGASPDWAPLSLSPPATARDLLRLAAVVVTFLGVRGLVRVRPNTARTTLTAVAVLGLVLIGLALVQELLATGPLLGFYTPSSTEGRRFFWSTFVNQNHFAAYLALAAPVALGLALDPLTHARRAVVWLGAFVALAAGVLLTLSRSGMLVLVGELVLFGALVLFGRQAKARDREPATKGAVGWGAVAVALLAVLAVTLLVAFPRLLAEWQTLGRDQALSGSAKLATLPEAWRLVQAFPWTGVGHGAYPEVFPAFNRLFPDFTFHYIENAPLQLAADLGLPAATLLLGLGLVLFVPLLLRSRCRPLLVGAAVGVAGVGIENLVDFSLALPGVALPTAALLAVVVARTPRRSSDDASGTSTPSDAIPLPLGGPRQAWRVLVLVLVGAAALAPAGWLALAHPVEEDRAAVATDATAIGPATRNHPADPSLAVAAGQRLALDGDTAGATAWLARAQRLFPRGFWPAMVRAEYALRTNDRRTAVVALAGALTYHGAHHEEHARILRLVRLRDDGAALLGEALAWVPARVVESVVELRREGAQRTSERLLHLGLAAHPDDAALLHELGMLYLANGLVREADRIATRLLALHPERAEAYQLQGDLALRRGDALTAEHMFREAVKLAPESSAPLFRRARALVALGAWGPLESVVRQLRARVDGPRERAMLHSLRAEAAEARGELAEALRHARDAVHEVPRYAPHLRQLARLLEAMDRPETALHVYEQILEIVPNDPAATRAITRLRGERTSPRPRRR